MRIVHLCLGAFYVDNYGYQENLLPKYHKQLGHDVNIVASQVSFNKDGKPCLLSVDKPYINEYGIPVERLSYRKGRLSRILKIFKKDVYDILCTLNPEIIFVHNLQFWDVNKVVKYAKINKKVRVFVDNHADFVNSGKSVISKTILHGFIWRWCAKRIEPYVEKFYGVLPARVDFLKDVYGLPKEKTELLVMGADDDKVHVADREKIRKELELGNKFTVITGGKIDHNKPEILRLMRVVAESDNNNVRLLVFGSVVPEFKEEFDNLSKSDKIIYIGWIKSEDVYDYYAASDIAFFPGKHSVLWEQAVGSGLPCIFRKMQGFDHIDIGGNCKFVEDLSECVLDKCLFEIIDDAEKYNMMKKAAEKGLVAFSYKEIAAKSIM